MGRAKYKMDRNNIILRKENTFEPYIPHLISRKDNSIFLNCPIESITDAALSELTGREYNVISSNTLIYSLEKTRSLDREIQNQKTLLAYSNQSL